MFNFLVNRVQGGYKVTLPEDPKTGFTVTKPNGKMLCDCPDFALAPKGSCDHIQAVVDFHRSQKPATSAPVSDPSPTNQRADERRRPSPAPKPEQRAQRSEASGPSRPGSAQPQPPSHRPAATLPELRQSETARLLELPFRPDQIKQRDGVSYLDGASVIQRLNDVLGTENWSFRLVGDPREFGEQVIVRGRLTAVINGTKVAKDDFGAHEHARKRSDKSIISFADTLKSAVTDCIKRCAHQLGVGLHLYSKDGSYRSFRPVPVSRDPALPTLFDLKGNAAQVPGQATGKEVM